MKLYPAVDLLDGRCVRLTQGDYERSEVFDDDPLAPFYRYLDAGARRVHVVDLNAAKGDFCVDNLKAVEAMVGYLPGAVQIGGGVRSRDIAARWLNLGADRVIVGTVAATNSDEVLRWIDEFPDRIVIGIDVLEGRMRTDGWRKDGGAAHDVAKVYAGSRIASVLCTNIARDGMLSGPDPDIALELGRAAGSKALVSGGVSTLQDLISLRERALDDLDLEGVVAGKALLSGAIDLHEAIAACL